MPDQKRAPIPSVDLAQARQALGDRIRWAVPSGPRRRLLDAREGLRLETARARTLPDLLIVGAQRSGTSSLYRYLRMHPMVFGPLRKEVDYFGFRYARGEKWYRANFPLEAIRSTSHAFGRPFLTFEATPDYLLHPLAAQRASALVPHAKIVVLLRDPVERAVSHYHHGVRYGWETLSFEQAIAEEDERIAGEEERIQADPSYRAPAYRRFTYRTRGHYAEQLRRWLDQFPRDQILVLDSARMFADPRAVLFDVLEFAGLPRWSPPEFRNYSYRGPSAPVTHLSISPEAEARLRAEFTHEQKELRDLIGYSFDWGARPCG